jgi:hypothetical protein
VIGRDHGSLLRSCSHAYAAADGRRDTRFLTKQSSASWIASLRSQ